MFFLCILISFDELPVSSDWKGPENAQNQRRLLCEGCFSDGLSFTFPLTAAALIYFTHFVSLCGFLVVSFFFSFLSNLCRCVSVPSLAWRRSVLKDHPDKIMAGVVPCRQTHILMGAHLDSCHASHHCPCVLNIVRADSSASTAGRVRTVCSAEWKLLSQRVVYLYSPTHMKCEDSEKLENVQELIYTSFA